MIGILQDRLAVWILLVPAFVYVSNNFIHPLSISCCEPRGSLQLRITKLKGSIFSLRKVASELSIRMQHEIYGFGTHIHEQIDFLLLCYNRIRAPR